MTIINIRGTSGSGKSHLARRILALYPNRVANYADGRTTPISYICTKSEHPRPLFVLGHYEGDTGGGADTCSERDIYFPMLEEAARTGCDVFWEGVIYSDERQRTAALHQKYPINIIQLTTSLEQCIADIKARRAARAAKSGKEPAVLSESNTSSRYRTIQKVCSDLKFVGLTVERLDREQAFLRCAELLGLK